MGAAQLRTPKPPQGLMRFGWLTLGQSPSADGDYAAIHEQVTQACFAETAGFDGIWLTEHNFTGESVYLPHLRIMDSMRRFGEQVIPRFR